MNAALPRVAALGLLLAALPASAAAPTAPKAIRDAVAITMETNGDGASPVASMFSALDINGDGKTDWKVDYGNAPNPSEWCGTGGCTVELWASQPGGGFNKVMEQLVRGFEVTHPNGGTRLGLDFHGTVCGGAGVDDCKRGYVWDEDTGWVAVANKDGKTWLYGGPVNLNIYERGDLPAGVAVAFAGLQAGCPPGGGTAELGTWSADRIPDINGDGQADWVLGGGYNTCVSGNPAAPVPLTVLVSGPDGRLRQAYSRPGMTFGVDIAARPAAFYVIPTQTECSADGSDLDKPCGTRMRWDGASGKLVE